jgi:hypothetical protein
MEIALTTNKNQWVKNSAKFGYMAKGVVYSLIGIMAAIAAFGSGSSKDAGKTDAFKLLLDQPMGKVLVFTVALGLVGYVAWRMIEAIKDPHHHGNEVKGIITRIGYGLSAAAYLGVSIYAFKLIFATQDSGGGTQKALVDKILDQSWGPWAIGIVGIILVGKGIQQILKSLSGKYRKEVESGRIDSRYREILVKTGGVGYIARGIVWGVIGYLFFRGAVDQNANGTGGTGEALSFLEKGFGEWVLGLVAIGLVCYGAFKILEGLYRRFDTASL